MNFIPKELKNQIQEKLHKKYSMKTSVHQDGNFILKLSNRVCQVLANNFLDTNPT